ncbi:uncharacterized protein MYCFIDRAFT_29348 [Pseudocercospora fijiensis CIRAD86]|uniref:Phytoene desaturase n=1 Tax=Pseudocercospora fijiensis (strain CIRAD86) TaxID=383855 RepID=M2ZAW2_PSEFD|nr:uncharacterized protein MYCFIDRAFT_29348 [Pseudocercospora fijiensis CIRAD86]EME86980.1 hypothetical protein MYCFIDRAFT_29348 [Pseudocercospora fijiensis CIRAD86]
MAEKPRQKTAIIIGAGVGGVSTAARLAKAGFKVTVLEKNSFTGGRCSLIHYNANAHDTSSSSTYRFDQGPSLLLLPHLFHRTFHDLDTSLESEGVHLLKCEPNYAIWFGDGQNFQMSSDLALMKREIEKWEGKAGYSRFLQYLSEGHRHYELSVEHVLLKNFTSLGSMLRWEFLKRLFELHPFESIWGRARKYFWSERLRRVFTFGSMYMGMSPFEAPGTYSLLQYTELAEGIWYPVGGFHRVVEALVRVGERLGVEYRLDTAVERIWLSEDGGKVKGVVLGDGAKLEADVVVNNSDLVYAYENLLPESEYAESLKSRPGSCSSISFYWALDRQVQELGAHNIFLADEYRESFDSIFKRHLIPDEPSFYVNVPSRIDPTAAPEGKDSIVVLVPVGHLIEDNQTSTPTSPKTTTKTQDWPSMISLARKTILSTITSRTGVDITPNILHELSNDPSTWKQTFNLDRGAILGLSHSFFNVLCFRPTTRARRPNPLTDKYVAKLGVVGRVLEVVIDFFRGRNRDVQGLYMVGASVHPGTGVPICLAGGGLVARQVCEDFGVEVPWAQHSERGGERVGRLDRLERPVWVDSWEQWVGILLVLAVGPWVFCILGLWWGGRGH